LASSSRRPPTTNEETHVQQDRTAAAASATAADVDAACNAALDMLHTGTGDPLVAIDAVIRARPDYGFAHCLRAAVLVMSSREDALEPLAQTLRAARTFVPRMDARERRHLAAASAWLARDLRRALKLYGDIVRDYPHDTLALRVAHFGDLQWGRTERLRDRVAEVLPHWNEGMHGYSHVLGMYAFGLAECGEHARAEQVARRALAMDERNAGAIHVIAHVMEMQGRSRDGIDWLRATERLWRDNVSYAGHIWWHLALYHLDLGDACGALRIYDSRLSPAHDAGTAALVDASALLWRLDLEGIDVAERWQAVADGWAARPLGSLRPFNDAHAMLAFAAAGRELSALALIEELRRSAVRAPDLGDPVLHAALPVCAALHAYGAARYEEVTVRIERIRSLAKRCGGSLAQCDLLHLTLVEAALRSGQIALAHGLVEERLALRPASAANRRLEARVSALMQATGRAGDREARPRAGEPGPLPLAA
jgi:hypothetical protein